MAFPTPVGQNIFVGQYASDAAATTFVQDAHWDDSGDGTGDPQASFMYWNTTDSVMKVWDGTSWVRTGIRDHGNLDGLGDDDHAQYLLVDGTRAMSGDLNMNSNKITGVAAPVVGSDATNKTYVDQAVQGIEWQDSVLDYVDNTAAPPTEVTDDRYILDDTGSTHADWDGASPNDIVEFDGSSWVATTPDEGYAAWVDAEDQVRVFNGSSWVTMASAVNHNSLGGLQGGTTDEYYHLTSSEYTTLTTGINASSLHIHDDRYYTETELGSTTGGSEGASLIGTDTKTNLDNATTVEEALTYLDDLNPSKVTVASGAPNGSVSGDEGDIYIRTDLAIRLKYMNVDGTNTGWRII